MHEGNEMDVEGYGGLWCEYRNGGKTVTQIWGIILDIASYLNCYRIL